MCSISDFQSECKSSNLLIRTNKRRKQMGSDVKEALAQLYKKLDALEVLIAELEIAVQNMKDGRTKTKKNKGL